MKNIFAFLLSAFAILSCTKSVGDIRGTVTDAEDGGMLSGCLVSLDPGGYSYTTAKGGAYEFNRLDVGHYVMTFSCDGYVEKTIDVDVVVDEAAQVDVGMKRYISFELSASDIDYGEMETSKEFQIQNNMDSRCSWEVSEIPEWLSLSSVQGTLSSGGRKMITATLDRNLVGYGKHSQNLIFSYSGDESGTVTLNMRFEKVEQTAPVVSIASEAENITETSFEVSGEIYKTGGLSITDYGHCWSKMPSPTVEDNRTSLGTSSAAGSFTSIVEDLTASTEYYVRAYASNEKGISYSNEIIVTTKEPYSDKWDGNVAKTFAGGTGTSVDPYIIKTGGQLMLVSQYAGSHFVLANNINLDNHNWKPFPFWGCLDAKGYVVSNLRIDRTEDNLGLFSCLSKTITADTYGQVKNLTIKGIHIDAPSNNNIGAIVGRINPAYNTALLNCKVIFTEDSLIKGNKNVGGVAGLSSTFINTETIEIQSCSVESSAESVALIGNEYVGGIAGSGTCSNCSVKLNIEGDRGVGGICGENIGIIENCSFIGSITGNMYVGGIAGTGTPSYSYIPEISASKSVASIYVRQGCAGGILGGTDLSSGYRTCIISCYTDGVIEGELPNLQYVGGIVGGYNGSSSQKFLVYHSYSTISSSLQNFDGIGKQCVSYDSCTSQDSDLSENNTSSQCHDIVSFMKDCYSEYAEFWNYNNTWMWTGDIDGKTVKISCPRLAWE